MSTIPRFLLPRRGPMWQTPLSAPTSRHCPQIRSIRSIATTGTRQAKPQPPSAGNILEKPAKFNPPSHGARLPRRNGNPNVPSSQHYGGDLSAAEQAAQRTRQYPGMMAPPGTWAHWIWTSRMFHMTLAVTTLTCLALFTSVENFKRRSPYVDLLPASLSEAAAHPMESMSTLMHVIRLTEEHRAMEMAEKRQQRIDDVAKRTAYRKAHGLDETVGFGSNSGWLGAGSTKKNGEPDASPMGSVVAVAEAAPEVAKDEKRKKYWGIF